jgi:hypothetical protein
MPGEPKRFQPSRDVKRNVTVPDGSAITTESHSQRSVTANPHRLTAIDHTVRERKRVQSSEDTDRKRENSPK